MRTDNPKPSLSLTLTQFYRCTDKCPRLWGKIPIRKRFDFGRTNDNYSIIRVNARFYVECRTGDRGVLGSNPGVTCRSRLHNSEIKPRMGCLVYSYIIPKTIIYGGREAERDVGRERRGGREGGRKGGGEGGREGGWVGGREGGTEGGRDGRREVQREGGREGVHESGI